jgi:hypothetical protein
MFMTRWKARVGCLIYANIYFENFSPKKYKAQAALVILGLFVCEFAYSHLKNDLKWHFSSQK